jgi:serine O-acetyltransferase
MALKKDYKRPRFMKDYEWRFQILLRKTEYWKNKNGFLKKIIYPYYLFKYKKFPD